MSPVRKQVVSLQLAPWRRDRCSILCRFGRPRISGTIGAIGASFIAARDGDRPSRHLHGYGLQRLLSRTDPGRRNLLVDVKATKPPPNGLFVPLSPAYLDYLWQVVGCHPGQGRLDHVYPDHLKRGVEKNMIEPNRWIAREPSRSRPVSR